MVKQQMYISIKSIRPILLQLPDIAENQGDSKRNLKLYGSMIRYYPMIFTETQDNRTSQFVEKVFLNFIQRYQKVKELG